MIDPVSFIVTCVALYGLLKRAPGVIAEALAEWEYARRGEESPTAAARRRRLEEMGVDPAAGGPMRQFAGNVWRDFWQDRDAERAAARARRGRELTGGASDGRGGWWDRLRDRVDAEVQARADQWRTRPRADQGPPLGWTDPGSQGPTPSDGPTAPTQPGPESPVDPPPAPTPDPGPAPTRPHPEPDYTEDPREPIYVDVTVGAPIPDPTPPAPTGAQPLAVAGTATAVLEGEPMSNAVAQQEITGVVSGAHEARAIQREIENAVDEFNARLVRVRARVQSLGEQTLGNVQMSTRSRVIAVTGQAAESAAAAQAAARGCAAEVGPLMGVVAREFDRLNS